MLEHLWLFALAAATLYILSRLVGFVLSFVLRRFRVKVRRLGLLSLRQLQVGGPLEQTVFHFTVSDVFFTPRLPSFDRPWLTIRMENVKLAFDLSSKGDTTEPTSRSPPPPPQTAPADPASSFIMNNPLTRLLLTKCWALVELQLNDLAVVVLLQVRETNYPSRSPQPAE